MENAKLDFGKFIINFNLNHLIPNVLQYQDHGGNLRHIIKMDHLKIMMVYIWGIIKYGILYNN